MSTTHQTTFWMSSNITVTFRYAQIRQSEQLSSADVSTSVVLLGNFSLFFSMPDRPVIEVPHFMTMRTENSIDCIDILNLWNLRCTYELYIICTCTYWIHKYIILYLWQSRHWYEPNRNIWSPIYLYILFIVKSHFKFQWTNRKNGLLTILPISTLKPSWLYV